MFIVFICIVLTNKTQESSDICCRSTSSPTRLTNSSELSTVKTADPLSVQFSTFVTTIEQLIKNCNEKLEQSKLFCSNLTISDNSDELLFNDEQIQNINACTTFNELFAILRKHWSWKDYSILTHIINITDLQMAKEELQLFKTRMGSYEGMKLLSENIAPEAISHEYIMLTVIIDKPYRELTLENFTKVRNFIFKYLDIKHYTTLPHIKFLFSSLQLEWYVLKKATSHMIKMAKQNEEVFIKNSVVFIQVDQSVVLDSTTRDKKQLVRTTTVCIKNYVHSCMHVS